MSTDWRFCADSPRDAALLIDEQRQDLAALRARVAEARGLLDRATQLLREDGVEYSLLSDIEDWLHPSAGTVPE